MPSTDSISVRRSLLAATIAVALLQTFPVTAASSERCEADDTEERDDCLRAEQKGSGDKAGMSKWAIGGGVLAALGVAAASGGGSSSSNGNPPPAGSGNPPPGGGNTPPGGSGNPPPQLIGEGTQQGGNGVMVAGGQQAVWSQGVNTQINGKNARNDGDLTMKNGSLSIVGEGELRNNSRIELAAGTRLNLSGDGEFDNHGTFISQRGVIDLLGESSIENYGTMYLDGTTISLRGDAEFDNGGNSGGSGQLTLAGGRFVLREMAEFENYGTVDAKRPTQGGVLIDIVSQRLPGEDDRFIEVFDNQGTIRMDGSATVLRMQADGYATTGVNRRGASIQSNAQGLPAVQVDGVHATFTNQGTITVTGDNAVAMDGVRGATLVNEGVINLGTQSGASGAGLVAMQSDGSAVLDNRAGGTINIYADQSYAFRVTGAGPGRLINNGHVNLVGTGSAIDAPPTALSQYTIGTNVDGTAGQMVFTRAGELADVDISTGFTAGTAQTTVRFEDVFVGVVRGEEKIRSQSVVWEAAAKRDDEGNIDVTMAKRDYADLVGGELADMAGALDRGYTNSALFRSLELASHGELQRAMTQLSGQDLAAGTHVALGNAHTFRAALQADRVSPGIYSLGYSAGSREGWGPKGTGQAMVMVTPGRLGVWDTQAGFFLDQLHGARDTQRAGLLGLGWTKTLGQFQWRQSLNSEWHALDSFRTLEYGKTHQQARGQRSLTRQSVDSALSRSFDISGLNLMPRLAISAYTYDEAAFREQGSAFGLNVGPGQATGLNLAPGMGWSWAPTQNWQLTGDVTMTKPLAQRESARRASFLNAPDVSFVLPGAQADRWDHRLALGVDHWHGAKHINVNLRSQSWLGQRDHGAELNWVYLF